MGQLRAHDGRARPAGRGAGPHGGDAASVANITYAAAGGATAFTVLAFFVAARRGSVLWRTAMLGLASGTSFGLTATMIKETVDRWNSDGFVAILTTWQTYTAVGFGILGVVTVQSALHIGPLIAAQPGFTLMDPLVAVLWGILVFDETVRARLVRRARRGRVRARSCRRHPAVALAAAGVAQRHADQQETEHAAGAGAGPRPV